MSDLKSRKIGKAGNVSTYNNMKGNQNQQSRDAKTELSESGGKLAKSVSAETAVSFSPSLNRADVKEQELLGFMKMMEDSNRRILSHALEATSADELSQVPSVLGMTIRAATKTLEAAGFKAGQISRRQHSRIPPGAVIMQNPAAGANAPAGTNINLTVSKHLGE